MKKVYYVEADCENGYNDEFVFWANTKVMATFTKRKEAVDWLIGRTRFLKDWCKEEITTMKKNAKKHKYNQTITIDCYKFLVDDDFNIEVDNVWDSDYEHTLIDSRYIMGRY